MPPRHALPSASPTCFLRHRHRSTAALVSFLSATVSARWRLVGMAPTAVPWLHPLQRYPKEALRHTVLEYNSLSSQFDDLLVSALADYMALLGMYCGMTVLYRRSSTWRHCLSSNSTALSPPSCTLAASVQRLYVGPQRLERNQDAVHRRMSKGNPIRSSYSLPSLAAPLTLHIG